MSQTQTKERSALDEFAAKAAESKGQVVPVGGSGMELAHVHGALPLQVYRDEADVFRRLRILAAEAGESWYYRWPVKDKRKGTTTFVEGPSIECANAVALLYGNCEVAVTVSDFGSTWLFHARFIDLQTGYSLIRPFQQRKGAAKMGDDAERNLDIAFQIGASKAQRNVVTNALRAFTDFAMREAKNSLIEKIGKNIEGYRSRLRERLVQRVELIRVETVVGRPIKDWLAPDISKVIAMATAAEEGMATWDETFPPLKVTDAASEPASAVLDQFAADERAQFNSAAADPSSPDEADADAAGATDAPASAPAAPDTNTQLDLAILKKEAIDMALLAARKGEAELDRTWLPDGLDEAFVKAVFDTCRKVALKQLRPEGARKYLEAL